MAARRAFRRNSARVVHAPVRIVLGKPRGVTHAGCACRCEDRTGGAGDYALRANGSSAVSPIEAAAARLRGMVTTFISRQS